MVGSHTEFSLANLQVTSMLPRHHTMSSVHLVTSGFVDFICHRNSCNVSKVSNVSLCQSEVSEDRDQAAPARPLQSPGQSSVERGQEQTRPSHLASSPPAPAPGVPTLSPVTSSKSLSPLTKRGRGRVPGFPQRVTQASASVNNVSESSETGLTRGHRHTGPVDTKSATVTESVQPTSANNLTLGLLGRLLITERERLDIYSGNIFMFISFFLQQGSTN